MVSNNGRVANTEKYNQILTSGTYIDRYGSPYGKYTYPFGTPYEQRSLPYINNPKAYHVYVLKKDILGITSSEISKAFNGTGGGMQYELPMTIQELLDNGYIAKAF